MKKSATPPLTFEECAHCLGVPDAAKGFTGLLEGRRFRRSEMDPVEGEPKSAYLQNEPLGVSFAIEDGRVVGFTLESTSQAALPDGVPFGQERKHVAKAWGRPAETSRFHDTFKRRHRAGVLRVECTFIKGVLDEVSVELWSHARDRERRDRERIDAAVQAPAVERDVPSLSTRWKKHLPDVATMIELIDLPASSRRVSAIVTALGLTLDGSDDEGVLSTERHPMRLGLHGGRVTSAAIFGDWGGGLEGGLMNGTATRAEVRAFLGKPSHSDERTDYFQSNGLRRTVTFLGGVVLGWSVERTDDPIPRRGAARKA